MNSTVKDLKVRYNNLSNDLDERLKELKDLEAALNEKDYEKIKVMPLFDELEGVDYGLKLEAPFGEQVTTEDATGKTISGKRYLLMLRKEYLTERSAWQTKYTLLQMLNSKELTESSGDVEIEGRCYKTFQQASGTRREMMLSKNHFFEDYHDGPLFREALRTLYKCQDDIMTVAYESAINNLEEKKAKVIEAFETVKNTCL